MQIDGLTPRQFELLEALWSAEDSEDLNHWFEKLPNVEKKTVISLLEVIRQEMVEPAVEISFDLANQVIVKAKSS